MNMDFANIFVILFFAGTLFDLLLNLILERLDYGSRKKNGMEISEELKPFITREKLELINKYEDTKYALWVPRCIFNTVVQLSLILHGFYPYVFNLLWNTFSNIFVTAFLFQLIFSWIFSYIVDLPFKIIAERIEKHFGFSNMTVKLLVLDTVKSLILEAFVIGLLSCVECLFILYCNSWWWLLLGAFYIVFSLLANVIYPVFIAPLFNKFTPVDGELKEKLESLLSRTGFKADGVFTMDASRRSNHSNAYFTGIGRKKRIVLYDTLIKQLDNDEIEAVLAHELGHYHKHHIIKRMIVMIPVSFVVLYIISFIIRFPSLYEGFGFNIVCEINSQGYEAAVPQIQFLGLWLLGIIGEGYTSLLSLAANFFSRRNEYEADSYAVSLIGSAKPLTSALIKLNKENLSEIKPDKVYAAFNYSHPPLMGRIENAQKVEKLNKSNKIES